MNIHSYTLSDDINHNTDIVEKVAAILLEWGVAVLPTDTIYGLAVLPQYADSVDRVYTLKNRTKTKNLPIMISSKDQAHDLWLIITHNAQILMDSPYMPWAISLVLEHTLWKWPDRVKNREETAFRIPNHKWLLAVLEKTWPLLVTSANLQDNKTPNNVTDILEELHWSPDVVVDGWIIYNEQASTIINCRGSEIVIERIGKISPSEIELLVGTDSTT